MTSRAICSTKSHALHILAYVERVHYLFIESLSLHMGVELLQYSCIRPCEFIVIKKGFFIKIINITSAWAFLCEVAMSCPSNSAADHHLVYSLHAMVAQNKSFIEC